MSVHEKPASHEMLNPVQKTWILIAPRVTSTLSIGGSSWIISNISKDKRKKQNTHHRLLLAMSIYDIIFSTWVLIGSIAMPKDTSLAGTFGNISTCEIQGFFTIIGGVVPIYNSFLGINAVLLVRYNTSSRRMKKLERYGHIFAAFWAVTTAVAAVITDSISPQNGFCWFQPVPAGCWKIGNCVRGAYAHILGYTYSAVSYVLSFIVAIISMIVLYSTVYNGETKISKYRMSNEDIRRKSKRVARQALLYLSCFFFSFIFAGATKIIITRGKWDGNSKISFIFYVGTAMYPLQGFLNFLVYWSSLSKKRKSRRRLRDSDLWSRIQSCVISNSNKIEKTEKNNPTEENYEVGQQVDVKHNEICTLGDDSKGNGNHKLEPCVEDVPKKADREDEDQELYIPNV